MGRPSGEVRGRQVPDGDRWHLLFARHTLRSGLRKSGRLHRLEADLARIDRVTTMGELSLARARDQTDRRGVTARTCLRFIDVAGQPQRRDAAA
jgi:hypothetical protein